MYRERRLSPSEAQRILGRALELQRAQGGGRELGDEELTRTLRDLGVEERFVQQALNDDMVASTDVGEKSHGFVGSPLRVVVQQRSPRVIDASDHPRLVKTLRRVVGEDGQAEIVGDDVGFTLHTGRRSRKFLRVTLSPSPEGTTMRVEENLRPVAGGLFGGILGSLGINALTWAVLGPLVFHAPFWLPMLLIGTWLGVWMILRVAFGAYVRSRRRHLTEIAEKIAAEVAAQSGRAPMRVEAAAPTRLARDDDDEAEAERDAAEGEDESRARRLE